jgi:LEA14-like dessication related protein
MAATYDKKSYLSGTPTKSFYLDIASVPRMDGVLGKYVIVPPECENRIDLFSYQQYGSSRYWWMIVLANADYIKDPIWDFKAGMKLMVPDKSRMLDEFSTLR